ncbi:MAG: hypothetical protein ACI9WL_001320, partial [Rubritalea sp.]
AIYRGVEALISNMKADNLLNCFLIRIRNAALRINRIWI